MKLVSKALVSSLSKQMGMAVLELDDCTRWSMIDCPFQNVSGSSAHVYKDGRQFYVKFDNGSQKFAVDEM